MSINLVSEKLISKGLKVTPQSLSILEAVITLNNHPTVEQIVEHIRSKQPNISIATVYKVLDALVENKDITRYDAIMEPHHHIYFSDSDTIVDYE